MENLFEYLISKENKKNIVLNYTKSMIKYGDIVKLEVGEIYYYMDEKLFKKILNASKGTSLYNYTMSKKSYPDGILITRNEETWKYLVIDFWDDNLKCPDLDLKEYDIVEVYPKRKSDNINTFDDLLPDEMKKLIKDRNRVKVR